MNLRAELHKATESYLEKKPLKQLDAHRFDMSMLTGAFHLAYTRADMKDVQQMNIPLVLPTTWAKVLMPIMESPGASIILSRLFILGVYAITGKSFKNLVPDYEVKFRVLKNIFNRASAENTKARRNSAP